MHKPIIRHLECSSPFRKQQNKTLLIKLLARRRYQVQNDFDSIWNLYGMQHAINTSTPRCGCSPAVCLLLWWQATKVLPYTVISAGSTRWLRRAHESKRGVEGKLLKVNMWACKLKPCTQISFPQQALLSDPSQAEQQVTSAKFSWSTGTSSELSVQMLFFPAAAGGSRQSVLAVSNLHDLGVDHIWAAYVLWCRAVLQASCYIWEYGGNMSPALRNEYFGGPWGWTSALLIRAKFCSLNLQYHLANANWFWPEFSYFQAVTISILELAAEFFWVPGGELYIPGSRKHICFGHWQEPECRQRLARQTFGGYFYTNGYQRFFFSPKTHPAAIRLAGHSQWWMPSY